MANGRHHLPLLSVRPLQLGPAAAHGPGQAEPVRGEGAGGPGARGHHALPLQRRGHQDAVPQ